MTSNLMTSTFDDVTLDDPIFWAGNLKMSARSSVARSVLLATTLRSYFHLLLLAALARRFPTPTH